MTTNTATSNSSPRLQIVSMQSINKVWSNYGMKDKQVATNLAWYREAQQLRPEEYNQIGDPASLPNSIITELYPEVVAFGPNGLQVTQMLQALIDINHYTTVNPNASPNVQKACDKLFAGVGRNLPVNKWKTFFREEEDAILWKIISNNLMTQREYLFDIRSISKNQKNNNGIVLYLGAVFAAQLTDKYNNPHLPALIKPITQPWNELKEVVTKAGINTYMPELKPETDEEVKIALPLHY